MDAILCKMTYIIDFTTFPLLLGSNVTALAKCLKFQYFQHKEKESSLYILHADKQYGSTFHNIHARICCSNRILSILTTETKRRPRST